MKKLACSILVLSTSAHADKRIEVGVALGGHAFSDSVELGVADDTMEPGPVSAGLVGAHIAVPLRKRLALEAELALIPTVDDVLGKRAMVYGLGVHARFDLMTGKLKPFVVAGLGAHVLRSSSPQMDNDADKALHWGAGVRYALKDGIDLRFDTRHLIVPGRTANGATSDFEMLAGVTYKLGKARQPVKPTPPPPVVKKAVDPPPPPPPVIEPPKPPVIEELAGIGFEHNSAVIDVYSAPILERAYSLLDNDARLSIEISGHTSSEGDPERNLDLSLRRAEAVKFYLVKRGIDPGRILTVGHGSREPIDDNRTEEGRRANRRIEFRIVQPE